MFPPRTRICLDCRVTLTEGEACTWLSHQVAELAGDCEPLVARVWGAPRAVDRAAYLRAFVLPESLPAPVTVRERDRPQGAATLPMVPVNAIGLRGRIEEAATAAPPVGRRRGVGFALELRHREAAGSPVMLRDGASAGFAVAGEDGRVLVVPPGCLRMEGSGPPVRARRQVEAHLRALAPDAGPPSPFPWDEVRVAVLAPGDRVTVRATASVRPDPRGTAGYREAPRSLLVASGAVWVEVLD